MEDFEYKEEYRYPTCACLNITDDCNLACRYCFVEQHPHYMNLETAKKSIDYLYNNYIQKENKEKIGVTFFGGEPLLLFEKIIVPTVLYANNKYPNLFNFSITTNGTLLDSSKINWLKKQNFSILLSIDGIKEVQDYNRPCKNQQSSFDLINKNIPLLLKYFPNTTFRATIFQDSCQNLFNSFIFAIENNFSSIFLAPNSRKEKWSKENLEILKNEIHKIFSFIYFCFDNNIGMPIYSQQINEIFKKILYTDLQNFIKEYNQTKCSRNVMRCGLGASSCSIAYDGKIYGCQEQDSKKEKNIFFIGDIYNGIDRKKHNILLSQYNKKAEIFSEKKENCNNCPLRLTCIDHGCPSESFDLFQNFFIKPETKCFFERCLFQDATKIMQLLVKENNMKFKEYLDILYKEGD